MSFGGKGVGGEEGSTQEGREKDRGCILAAGGGDGWFLERRKVVKSEDAKVGKFRISSSVHSRLSLPTLSSATISRSNVEFPTYSCSPLRF